MALAAPCIIAQEEEYAITAQSSDENGLLMDNYKNATQMTIDILDLAIPTTYA